MFRIEGRNILDSGFSGANVRDMETGRLTKEGAANMVRGIRRGMGEGISKSSPSLIGKTSATIAESIGKNTEDLQRILNETSDENKQNIEKIIKSLSDSQDKQGTELIRAVNAITEQIEKLRVEAGDQGDELIEKLGLDKAKQQLGGGSLSTHPLADKFNKYIGADVGQSALSGLAQVARQPSLLLGFKPKREEDAIRRGRASAIRSEQNKSIGNVMSMLSGEGDTGIGNTPGGQTQSKVMPKFSSGLDIESNIEETLLDMKKLLEQIAECSCDKESSSILSDILKLLTAGIAVTLAAVSINQISAMISENTQKLSDSLTNSISNLFTDETSVTDVNVLDTTNPTEVLERYPSLNEEQLQQVTQMDPDIAELQAGILERENTEGDTVTPIPEVKKSIMESAADWISDNKEEIALTAGLGILTVLAAPEIAVGASAAAVYTGGRALIGRAIAMGTSMFSRRAAPAAASNVIPFRPAAAAAVLGAGTTAAAAEPSVVETGNAIENTTDLFTPQANSTPIIQNITNNNNNSSNSSATNVFSSQVRDDSSSWRRAQDRINR